MNRGTRGLGAAIWAVWGLASAGWAADGAQWTSVRDVEVTDDQRGMKAFTLGVPVGWKFAAEVVHDTTCHGKGASLKSTAASPDGGTVIAFLPGFSWSYSTSPLMRESMEKSGCPAIALDTAAAFLVNIAVPNLRPGATITDILPLAPGAQAFIKDQEDKQRQAMAASAAQFKNKPMKQVIDGARVRLRYTNHGQVVEEQIQTIIDCTEREIPAMAMMQASSMRTCAARNLFVARTPPGRLAAFVESPALLALNKHTQMNPDWMQRISEEQIEHFKQMQAHNDAVFQAQMNESRQNHEALMRRGEAFQQQEKTRFEHAMAADRAAQNATDQAAHRQVLVSLGRQDFRNPANGQIIEANAYYDHQWMSSDGSTLIQTDNPNLDPNGSIYPVSQSWTELVPR